MSICVKLLRVAEVTHIEGNSGHPTIKKNRTSRGKKTDGLGQGCGSGSRRVNLSTKNGKNERKLLITATF